MAYGVNETNCTPAPDWGWTIRAAVSAAAGRRTRVTSTPTTHRPPMAVTLLSESRSRPAFLRSRLGDDHRHRRRHDPEERPGRGLMHSPRDGRPSIRLECGE